MKLDGTTPAASPLEGATGLTHSVTISITAGTNCKLVPVNNEQVWASPFFGPQIWPISCDVNRDCKVNILDLISVRNKLNQPVSTADNVFADVNMPVPDNKINILDLIAVRNKLNTTCPQ